MAPMASPTTPSALAIPADAPRSKFVRYVRAVSAEYAPLFPITPATRPLVVGLDLRTLGPRPADYEELVHVLRRDVVTSKLMVFADDDTARADEWMRVCEAEDRHVIHYTNPQGAGRFMDALEFGLSTMQGERRRAARRCHTFDVYSVIDAHD
jgi:hypothetical protein